MFHALTVKGQQGRVRVGYQTAAALGPYTLTPTGPNAWNIEARIVSHDPFWWNQGTHTLEVSVGQQRWRWASVSLAVDGGVLRGQLTGRPERR